MCVISQEPLPQIKLSRNMFVHVELQGERLHPNPQHGGSPEAGTQSSVGHQDGDNRTLHFPECPHPTLETRPLSYLRCPRFVMSAEWGASV